MIPALMARDVLVGLSKDGTYFWWRKGKGHPTRPDEALPVFSVNSEEEAKDLQMLVCRLSYPPNSRYIINTESGFDGTLETLDDVTAYMEERYGRIIQNRN